jgi:hypothetical protein
MEGRHSGAYKAVRREFRSIEELKKAHWFLKIRFNSGSSPVWEPLSITMLVPGSSSGLMLCEITTPRDNKPGRKERGQLLNRCDLPLYAFVVPQIAFKEAATTLLKARSRFVSIVRHRRSQSRSNPGKKFQHLLLQAPPLENLSIFNFQTPQRHCLELQMIHLQVIRFR